jgi:hypothetical protein
LPVSAAVASSGAVVVDADAFATRGRPMLAHLLAGSAHCPFGGISSALHEEESVTSTAPSPIVTP